MLWGTWGFLLATSWLNVYRVSFPFPIFHQQNKDMNQSERRPRLFSCGGSERAFWNALTMGCFNFFLEFFFGGVPLIRPCCLSSYLRGFWIHWRLAVCAASLLWPRLSRTTSRNASRCSLNVSSMSRRSSRIYDCFCNASKRFIFKHKCLCIERAYGNKVFENSVDKIGNFFGQRHGRRNFFF